MSPWYPPGNDHISSCGPMNFLFHRWDILVPRRACLFDVILSSSTLTLHPANLTIDTKHIQKNDSHHGLEDASFKQKWLIADIYAEPFGGKKHPLGLQQQQQLLRNPPTDLHRWIAFEKVSTNMTRSNVLRVERLVLKLLGNFPMTRAEPWDFLVYLYLTWKIETHQNQGGMFIWFLWVCLGQCPLNSGRVWENIYLYTP